MEGLMEDPFVDLLEDDTDAVQGSFSLQEVNDYGRLYEYSSEFADFAAWDADLESKLQLQSGVQAPESVRIETQVVVEVADPSDVSEVVSEDVSGSPGEEVGDAGRSKTGFRFAESGSADIGGADSELRSEMLELLAIFEAVYENKAAVDRASLLKTCISMCDRIMDRYYRLPHVVTMREQAQSLLHMFENGDTGSIPPSNFAGESSTSSGMSFRDHLKADVKEALDRVDRDAEESELSKDRDVGRVVDGVYVVKGIWYCETHVEREQCEECEVDDRLLNQVHRERTQEAGQVDETMRKEQQRLEELELQRTHSDPEARPTPVPAHKDLDNNGEDFQSIAKDLKEELARAREKEEADFLKCFASFQIA